MKSSRTATMARRTEMVTLVPSTASAVTTSESTNKWTEGRRKFLQVHQDRYLHRLTILRETLLRENKDFVKLNLPKDSDKNTGFWEAILSDFDDSSLSKKFPHSKSHRSVHDSLGSSMSDEKQRRGHLERLRRIRIMQMQKRLPPQLEPLHGIGLGAKKDSKTKENKHAVQRVPSTAYHVDWMKGNHVITPIGDHEKAINSWTLKHLRTVDVVRENEAANCFPNDIRSLLRRTRHSVDNIHKEVEKETKKQTFEEKGVTPVKEKTQLPFSKRSKSIGSRKTNTEPVTPPTPPPAPASTPSLQSPFMSEIISHHSTSTSRVNSGSRPTTKEEIDDEEENITVDGRNSELVDRATSPIGFRLPHRKSPQESPTDEKPDSANSKRHIVVKIPHGLK